MQTWDINRGAAAAFAARYFGAPEGELRLRSTALRGGLCSAVSRVRVSFSDGQPSASFVVKVVRGTDVRESWVYQDLLAGAGFRFAPRLLGAECLPDGSVQIYLEWISRERSWPWSEVKLAGLVLDRLAEAHQQIDAGRFGGSLRQWDYEAELAFSAATTLDLLECNAREAEHGRLKRLLAPARRMVAGLATVRRTLLAAEPIAVVHGDAHPGNVILGRDGRPVLLDWARARLGSPLEDVSSWLQSLAFWEPEARRRHDLLLRHYLAARGRSTSLGRSVRDLYWLARGCNALAGAMAYHLSRLQDAGQPDLIRYEAAAAVHDWGRSLVRADAVWGSVN